MSDIYESSDRIKTVQNRQLGASIFEATRFIGPDDWDTFGSIVQAQVEVDLADLNLDTLVPEVSATLYLFTVADGIHYNTHYTLPYSRWDISATQEERAYLEVFYRSSGGLKDGYELGTSKLYCYVQRSTIPSGAGTVYRIDFKIKGSDAITAN
jgi:hypothetical protein